MFLLMNKIKKDSSNLNSVSKSSGNKKFLTLPNILYVLIISSSVSVILTKLFGIVTVSNILQLYIIVLAFTVAVLYQLLKEEKMTLDILESKSVLYFLAFVIFIGFFGLFLKFTSMEKESAEGQVFAIVFVLLVFALANLIFFIIGMG